MDENGEETPAVQAEENAAELKDTNGTEKASEVANSPESDAVLSTKKPRGRGRAKATISGTEQGGEKKREKKEPTTPLVERPARERKSIDRFAASVEKEKVKEFKIEKGAGAYLKDIPNVVFKLSKRKGSDDIVQLLHKLLYGKRIKPLHAKTNILQFSGYVWGTSQEKDKAKIKERLEKCVKESLSQLSDILDLNVPKAGMKKEDLVLKVLEFLECPHKTTDKLLEELEQKSKVKKRKKTPSKGTKKKGTPRKKAKREEKPSKAEKSRVDEEEEEEAEEEEEDVEEEAEEEPVKKKRAAKDSDDDYDTKSKNSKKRKRNTSKKQVAQEEDDAEVKATKSKPSAKSPKKKAEAKPTKSPVQSPSKDSKKGDADSSKVFLRKKKKEEEPAVEDSPKKEKGKGSTQANAKEESKPKLKVKVTYPSDDELRAAICELLQDVDFSTVTFTDVVKQLGKRFDVDLSQNKAHVKELIQEEISKIVDEDEGEGEDDNGVDENAEKEKEKEDSDAGDVNNQATED